MGILDPISGPCFNKLQQEYNFFSKKIILVQLFPYAFCPLLVNRLLMLMNTVLGEWGVTRKKGSLPTQKGQWSWLKCCLRQRTPLLSAQDELFKSGSMRTQRLLLKGDVFPSMFLSFMCHHPKLLPPPTYISFPI